MSTYLCGVCQKLHEGPVMDVGFIRPDPFFNIPEAERSQRIKLTKDLCAIDDRTFFIRGVLRVPVLDSQENFFWGVWAQVDERDFYRYIQLWNADITKEPPFPGKLANEIPPYQNTVGLDLQILLQSGNDRPQFEVVAAHPLGADQRTGVQMSQVHEFIHIYR